MFTRMVLLPLMLASLAACERVNGSGNDEGPTPTDAPATATTPVPPSRVDAPGSVESPPTAALPAKLEMKFEEAVLATIPAGTKLDRIEFSPVGHQVAFVAVAGDQEWVSVGAIEHERFDRITGLYWSPAGAPLAYTASRGGEYFVVVDGEVSKAYAGTTIPEWSPDGSALAYAADGRLIIGGETIEPIAPVWEHRWRPDNRFVYIAMTGPGTKVLITGPDDPPSDSFEYSLPLQWSLDGRHLAYAASVDDSMMLVVDGVRTERPGIVGDMRWSPDGATLAYATRDDDSAEFTVMVGDAAQGPFEAIGELAWSPDAKQLAFPAKRRGKFELLGPKPSAAYDEVSTPAWSPDSEQVAFVASIGELQHVVVGDVRGEPFDRVFPESLTWSPDATKLAYLARRGNSRIVVAGTHASEPHDWAGFPRWSPDGTQVGYGVRVGSELRWVVLPGA